MTSLAKEEAWLRFVHELNCGCKHVSETVACMHHKLEAHRSLGFRGPLLQVQLRHETNGRYIVDDRIDIQHNAVVTQALCP